MSNLDTYLSNKLKLDGWSDSSNILKLEVISKFENFFMTNQEKAEIIIELYTTAISSNISRAGSAAVESTRKGWEILLADSNKLVGDKEILLAKEEVELAKKEVLLEKENLTKTRAQLLLKQEELNKATKMIPLEVAKGLLIQEETNLISVKNETLPIDRNLIIEEENKINHQILNAQKEENILNVENDNLIWKQKMTANEKAFAAEMENTYKKKIVTGEQQKELIRRQSQGYKDNLLAKAAEFRGGLASFAINVDNVNAQARINEFNSTITALKARGNY